ncbi:MAG TPA: hypothetical protein VLA29_07115 [Acidimicrobiia bacterium]|nr:hypothetical protein [Acidimicrobiia bacterium]
MTVIVVSCAGSGSDVTSTTDAGADASSTTVATPTSATPPGAPTPFPVPIVSGGEIVAEAPGEVAVSYPVEMFDALVGFYEQYALDRGGRGGELFEGGIEYQFDQDGDRIVVSVTPEDDGALTMIRVLP